MNDLQKMGEILRFMGGKSVGRLFGYLDRYTKGFQDCQVFDAVLKMVAQDEDE